MYHKKKIGVFVSHIFGEYQRNVCQGILDKASEYGYATEIFATTDGENLGKYSSGESSILRIPNISELSGVIFVSSTYPLADLRNQIEDFLKHTCTCPVIEIRENRSIFPAISLKNNSTSGQLTNHLITVHHCQRICFLGNNTEPYFSKLRENSYREAMSKHELSISDHDVYECSFEQKEVDRALQLFLQDGTPDAIVCYNDHMAILMMISILNAGLRVPEDIKITGCDCLEEGQILSTPLTTVSFPVYQLGCTSVEQLIHLIKNEPVPPVTNIQSQLCIGKSCGCNSEVAPRNPIYYIEKQRYYIQDLEASIFTSMRMSAGLQEANDVDEAMDQLEKYIAEMNIYSEFYLCLYENWDCISPHIQEITQTEDDSNQKTDQVLLKLAFKNGKRLPECSFTKKSILPDFIYRNSTASYLFTPLFFGEREFGYIAMAYSNNQLKFHFQSIHWLMNINQVLQRICDDKRTGMLVGRLEEIYQKDSLTGLLNQHGYESMEKELIQKALEKDTTIACLVLDLNDLKLINDQYGHEEGDWAIQVVGQALGSSSSDDILCARFNGDEFFVFILGYSLEQTESYLRSITSYLDNYNRLNSKPYKISVTAGMVVEQASKMDDPYNTHPLFDLATDYMLSNKSKNSKE